eukprot:3685523-Pyramimonas_sp.AAC.1
MPMVPGMVQICASRSVKWNSRLPTCSWAFLHACLRKAPERACASKWARLLADAFMYVEACRGPPSQNGPASQAISLPWCDARGAPECSRLGAANVSLLSVKNVDAERVDVCA